MTFRLHLLLRASCMAVCEFKACAVQSVCNPSFVGWRQHTNQQSDGNSGLSAVMKGHKCAIEFSFSWDETACVHDAILCQCASVRIWNLTWRTQALSARPSVGPHTFCESILYRTYDQRVRQCVASRHQYGRLEPTQFIRATQTDHRRSLACSSCVRDDDRRSYLILTSNAPQASADVNAPVPVFPLSVFSFPAQEISSGAREFVRRADELCTSVNRWFTFSIRANPHLCGTWHCPLMMEWGSMLEKLRSPAAWLTVNCAP